MALKLPDWNKKENKVTPSPNAMLSEPPLSNEIKGKQD